MVSIKGECVWCRRFLFFRVPSTYHSSIIVVRCICAVSVGSSSDLCSVSPLLDRTPRFGGGVSSEKESYRVQTEREELLKRFSIDSDVRFRDDIDTTQLQMYSCAQYNSVCML